MLDEATTTADAAARRSQQRHPTRTSAGLDASRPFENFGDTTVWTATFTGTGITVYAPKVAR